MKNITDWESRFDKQFDTRIFVTQRFNDPDMNRYNLFITKKSALSRIKQFIHKEIGLLKIKQK